MCSDPIQVRDFECWNMSLSMLFGKTPKVTMSCGKCRHIWSKRFTGMDFRNGYKNRPVSICPRCNTSNYVPMAIS
jgi:hypothetical protein